LGVLAVAVVDVGVDADRAPVLRFRPTDEVDQLLPTAEPGVQPVERVVPRVVAVVPPPDEAGDLRKPSGELVHAPDDLEGFGIGREHLPGRRAEDLVPDRLPVDRVWIGERPVDREVVVALVDRSVAVQVAQEDDLPGERRRTVGADAIPPLPQAQRDPIRAPWRTVALEELGGERENRAVRGQIAAYPAVERAGVDALFRPAVGMRAGRALQLVLPPPQPAGDGGVPGHLALYVAIPGESRSLAHEPRQVLPAK
jgi:hypothetical protein